jgi:hypothetical protein
MKPKRTRGGIASNVDINLTDKERESTTKDEWNTHVVEEAIRESDTYQYHGALGRNSSVTVDQDNWNSEDVRSRRAAGKPVIPVFHFLDEDGDVCWILTDEDRAACEQGYICENCLGWQKFPNLRKCELLNGNSCGYSRRLI